MMPDSKVRKIFHRLVPISEATKLLENQARVSVEHEEVPVVEAAGRILASSVFSAVDLPPFDRVEMDGYAVISCDLEGADDQSPVKLKMIGEARAGIANAQEIKGGQCVEVGTGAPVPRGADAVVMVEYTSKLGENVNFYRPTTPGENIASAGSDVQAGEMILREGTVVGTREAGILSAVGLTKVGVLQKPIVGIISTGDELVEPGDPLGPGRIYDVNSTALQVAVEEAGGKAVYLGRIGDEYGKVKRAIARGLTRADVLILSGGTSAGAGDLVYQVLGEYQPGILVHGLNVKPGKPTIVAVHGTKPIFGLPGYPISALIIFDQLVRPYLEKLSGRPPLAREVIRAELAERVNGAKGKRWFLPIHLIRRVDGSRVAYPMLTSSGAIGALAQSDGYIVISEDVEFLDAGVSVEAHAFPGRVEPDLVFMGSHCPGVDLLLELLFRKHGLRAKAANIGSMGGLRAVVRGEADIAGIHLLDPATMAYNEPYLSQEGLPRQSLVKGYRRLQGIMIAKGNPKGVRDIGDALRSDLIFVNRNRGSGTRVLTDHLLEEVARHRGTDLEGLSQGIRGYRWEAKTHSAVGAAVSQGRADMGVGVKSVAVAKGLDFIPLGYEEYDFVLSPIAREKHSVRLFLEVLRSREFQTALKALPGYQIGRVG